MRRLQLLKKGFALAFDPTPELRKLQFRLPKEVSTFTIHRKGLDLHWLEAPDADPDAQAGNRTIWDQLFDGLLTRVGGEIILSISSASFRFNIC